MEDVNKQRGNFVSLSELEFGPLNFSFRRVRLQLTKWVGIIPIKTERTQIHFLRDVLVAVASLDLKVPNGSLITASVTSRHTSVIFKMAGKFLFRYDKTLQRMSIF